MPAALLTHRTLVRLGGDDRITFLQGLVSNDVTQASPTRAVYAALLTPQGKFLHDLFITEHDDALWLDCETTRAADLIRRLTAYKLRAKITLDDVTADWNVWALWNDTDLPPNAIPDPRLPALGSRTYLAKNQTPANTTDPADYDQHRLRHGIAEGSRDLEIEKSTLIEANFDLFNGIDWKKGCYVGQELTARMHYRGLAKRRLFPVRIDGKIPAFGTLLNDDAGEMRSASGTSGLVLARIDAVLRAHREKKPLTCEETRLFPTLLAGMKIDASDANR